MKYSTLAILIISMFLIGSAIFAIMTAKLAQHEADGYVENAIQPLVQTPAPTPTDSSGEFVADVGWSNVFRYIDTEENKVCYVVERSNGVGISCVQR